MAKPKDTLMAEWFWTDRWSNSSGFHLPLEARGLYREMLTQAWKRGARLPNDHGVIQRITGCSSAEWRRCWPRVERFWKVDGDGLVNETQLEVYAEAKARQQRFSERGRAGAQARHSNASGSSSWSAQAQPSLRDQRPYRTSEDQDDETIEMRAGRLLQDLYPEWFSKYRNGAKLRLIANSLLFQDALSLVSTWDDERLEKLARIVLTTDDEFISRTDRSFKIFAMKASWADDRLRQIEAA